MLDARQILHLRLRRDLRLPFVPEIQPGDLGRVPRGDVTLRDVQSLPHLHLHHRVGEGDDQARVLRLLHFNVLKVPAQQLGIELLDGREILNGVTLQVKLCER
ncbi:hypothetical protein SDC9_127259 [bioreactor metagenome]|uniref:Uncharacterized protein n=1 Tax=bioreactor metagenome TaxID=1076179 RepID=A0A645CU46_9ZZZZ